MNKRSYGVWFCLVLWGLCPLLAAAQITDPLYLENGLLTGMSGSDPAVQVYKGIPYAAPPVGALRWHAPQPSSPWEGVRKADTFAPGCIQHVAGSRPPWTEELMHQDSISEDCLYLNVWTAANDAGERRPVLVYIHGGGFSEGSGSVAAYDGEELAKKGLVVVTINYRLGALGFLAHPELTAESGDNASGNFGLLDQVAALQWVKQNIAAFGGDPNNVTIAGQSAGAIAVYLLTVAPPARSLFERGIPWPERPEFGAFHTAEVPYFFNNLRMLDRPWEPLDRQLADMMSSYWANFATGGNPNGAGLPEWPAYDGQDVRFMRFGERVAPGPIADPPVQEFFKAFLAE